MSYQEKRTFTTILVGLAVLISYLVYVFSNPSNLSGNNDDIKNWALSILTFIAIGIVLTIITQIVFHIAFSIGFAIKEKIKNPELSDKEIESGIKSLMVTDERDKIVELKSLRVGFIMAGIGFVLGLILILLDYSVIVMLNTFFISFSLGSLLEGLVQIFYYRRGVKHA